MNGSFIYRIHTVNVASVSAYTKIETTVIRKYTKSEGTIIVCVEKVATFIVYMLDMKLLYSYYTLIVATTLVLLSIKTSVTT